jgi:glycosyltransferase involved in cell wall biosynthesis
MERDIRRNTGHSSVLVRQLDPSLPYGWVVRLGAAAIPAIVAGKIWLAWMDCVRCAPYYGVARVHLPLALAVAVWVHLLEIGDSLRILMPSIVDPAIRRGGAWTVTRGLVELLGRALGDADVSVVVPPEPVWRRVRQAACVAAAPWTGMPAKARFLYARAFREQVRRRLAGEHFDLVIINGSDLLWCLDEVPPRLPTLVIVHNCEAQLFTDQVATAVPRGAHWLLRSEAARLRRFEVDGLRRVHAAIFLSESDAADFAAQLPGLDYLVLPPQFSEPPARVPKDPSERLDVGFLANFGWWPNRDGARWLTQHVLGRLPDDVRLHLFGSGSARVCPADPRLVAHGFVNDLREVWRACDWMAIPIRYGAGVSVKAAESIYHGMPILSTSFGLRGLPALDHPQIIRRESAEEWVAFLSSSEARVLSRERLPLDVSRHFRLEANLSRFDRFLARLLRLRATAAPAA